MRFAKFYPFLLSIFLLQACATTSKTVKSNAEIDLDERLPQKELPNWVTENCLKKSSNGNTFYYFIGYGEGRNSSTAVSNALINSRQNALTCIFGGTISSTVSLNENNYNADLNSSTELTLSYSDLNWSGFEKVPERNFYADSTQRKIYMQYRWGTIEIEKEKARLANISKKIDETKAIEKEVQLKKKIIEKQKDQLKVLNRQAIELENIKSKSERAMKRLQNIADIKQQEENEIEGVIKLIPCGMSIGEFISNYTEPTSRGRAFYKSAIFWGDWMLLIENNKNYYKRPIKYIFKKKGLTGKFWDVCEERYRSSSYHQDIYDN